MRLGRILLCVLLCRCVEAITLAALAPIVDQPWYRLQTPNFTVLTSAPLDVTWQRMVELEQFREAYFRLAGRTPPPALAPTVYVFPNDQAFRPFEPLYQGDPVRVGGFYHRDGEENVIAINGQGRGASSKEALFHEYTHFLLQGNDSVWPVWLAEGMADLYSTFSVETNWITVGQVKRRHAAVLRTSQLLPLPALLAVTHNSPEYNEQDQRGVFYAESWALTHYLALGNSERRGQFAEFLRRLSAGESALSAFASAFRATPAQIESELRSYVQADQFNPQYFQLASTFDPTKPAPATPVARPDLLCALGNLLLHVRRLDEAKEYFGEARRLAPSFVRAYEGLGQVAASRLDFPQTVPLLGEAIRLGSRDYRVFYEYARALVSSGDGRIFVDAAPPATLATATSAAQQSVALAPRSAPTYYLLGLLESNRNPLPALRYFESAVQLDSGSPNYWLGLARMQARLADYAGARRSLNAVLFSNADAASRQTAEALLRSLSDPALGWR